MNASVADDPSLRSSRTFYPPDHSGEQGWTGLSRHNASCYLVEYTLAVELRWERQRDKREIRRLYSQATRPSVPRAKPTRVPMKPFFFLACCFAGPLPLSSSCQARPLHHFKRIERVNPRTSRKSVHVKPPIITVHGMILHLMSDGVTFFRPLRGRLGVGASP